MKPSFIMVVPWPTVLHVVGFFLNRNVGRAQRFFQYRAGLSLVLKKKSARGRVQKGYFRVCRVFLGIKSIKGRPDISDRPNMSGIPEILGDTRHFGLPDT